MPIVAVFGKLDKVITSFEFAPVYAALCAPAFLTFTVVSPLVFAALNVSAAPSATVCVIVTVSTLVRTGARV